jgi:hypothetical protein
MTARCRSGAIYRAKSNEEINGKQKSCSGAGAPSELAERGNDSRMSRMDAAKGGVEQERIDAGPSEA